MQCFQQIFLEEPKTKASRQELVLLNTRIIKNNAKITLSREKLLRVI